MSTEDIKKSLRKKKRRRPIKTKDLLSTGSALLNLACTGRVEGGFVKGRYHFFVGDSASGKTWFVLTLLAEAAKNKHFKNYRFIHDDAEGGALMDVEKFFGKRVLQRLEPPATDDDGPVYSRVIEDFYFNVDDAIKDGRPFIYILDSMDSLSSKAEGKKFDETKKAHRSGKEAKGDYGDGKAKKNSSNLRKLLTPLQKSKSILIIINQTRDNLDFGFETKTRSGGRALRFYSHLEIWSSIAKKLKKTVRGKKREIGIQAKIEVKKNRFTGRLRTVEVPLYHSHGIDDIGSCVEFLISENHWKQREQSINASDFEFKGTMDKLIRHIEDEELTPVLHEIVAEVWNDIEEASAVRRKPRYT